MNADFVIDEDNRFFEIVRTPSEPKHAGNVASTVLDIELTVYEIMGQVKKRAKAGRGQRTFDRVRVHSSMPGATKGELDAWSAATTEAHALERAYRVDLRDRICGLLNGRALPGRYVIGQFALVFVKHLRDVFTDLAIVYAELAKPRGKPFEILVVTFDAVAYDGSAIGRVQLLFDRAKRVLGLVGRRLCHSEPRQSGAWIDFLRSRPRADNHVAIASS